MIHETAEQADDMKRPSELIIHLRLSGLKMKDNRALLRWLERHGHTEWLLYRRLLADPNWDRLPDH